MRKTPRRILYSADEDEMRQWLETAPIDEIEQVLHDTNAEDPIHELARSEQALRRTLVPVGRPLLPPEPDGKTRATFWLSLAAAVFSLLALLVASLGLRLQLRAPPVAANNNAPGTALSNPGTPPAAARPRNPSPEPPAAIVTSAAPPAESFAPTAPPPIALATPPGMLTAAPAVAAPEEDFPARVRASQERAVARHPELAQARTPLNARFVAAYQRLKLSGSPRLLEDPDWPEKLAEECAADLAGDSPLPER